MVWPRGHGAAAIAPACDSQSHAHTLTCDFLANVTAKSQSGSAEPASEKNDARARGVSPKAPGWRSEGLCSVCTRPRSECSCLQALRDWLGGEHTFAPWRAGQGPSQRGSEGRLGASQWTLAVAWPLADRRGIPPFRFLVGRAYPPKSRPRVTSAGPLSSARDAELDNARTRLFCGLPM